MGIFEYEFAEVEDGGEILGHLVFEFGDLLLCHLILGLIEYFFAEHLEYGEVVLADGDVVDRGGADVGDECFPSVVPFIFDDLDEDEVAFREDVLHWLREVLAARVLEDEVHHVATHVAALLFGKRPPFLLN